MPIFYYDALPKVGNLDAERNKNQATAKMHRTRDMLTPFYQYLDTAIKTMENKANIRARWQKVRQEGLVKLQPLDYLYQVEKTTKISLQHNQLGVYRIIGECDMDFEEPLKFISAGEKGEIKIGQENLVGPGLLKLGETPVEFDRVIWGFFSIQLEPAWTILNSGDALDVEGQTVSIQDKKGDILVLDGIISEKDNLTFNGKQLDFTLIKSATLPPGSSKVSETDYGWIVKGKKQPSGHKKVRIDAFLSPESLRWEKESSPFEGEKSDEGFLVFQGDHLEEGIGKTVINSHGLRFKVVSAQNDSRVRFYIQLLEIEEEVHEDLPGASPLRFFFDDDIEVEDDKRNRYNIIRGIEGERKLLLSLKNRGGGRREPCFPEGNILSVRVNTYQLRRQKDAVQSLQNKPVLGHENLIKLFEDRERVTWGRPSRNSDPLSWHVLTDPDRNGAKEQREFVEKALLTPDFAILEGPPGSGKTTVILELICQLVKEGKRILLCGSTHVAIDNVLERLKEKELLSELSILPVRIGDERRISNAVVEFQINRLVEDARVDEALLLEASNLVCGTTIGILQHPDMKNIDQHWKERVKTPISPQFDYLIIDESSKTTFQEFLVPALYAKHWILVGDVRQLSPFTDREQLVSNISQMPLKGGKTLPEALQQACLNLYKLREMLRNSTDETKFIFVADQAVIDHLFREWGYLGKVPEFEFILVGFVSRNTQRLSNENQPLFQGNSRQLSPIIVNPTSGDWVSVFAPDVLFVEHTTYKEYASQLPMDATVVNVPNWLSNDHAFRVAVHSASNRVRPQARERGKELFGHAEINDHFHKYFSERTWADEVAWRIDREHQLRMKEPKSTSRLTDAIEDLLPKSLGNEDDVSNRLNTIAAVALPSILEMLDRGLTKRRSRKESTLTQGFTTHEKKNRHVLLRYQQRMHPDMSAFPREQFYRKEALLDMDRMEDRREWSFDRYPHRSSWLDVKGKTNKNYNQEEVKALKAELLPFLEWASQQKPPDDGRDAKNEWSVGCLTFYRGQEGRMRDMLRETVKQYGSHNQNAFSSFSYQTKGGYKINIKLHTVDKFQGQEADIVYLSMVQTYRDGFMDSPNRLNVAITRARYQLVVIGDHTYFNTRSRSEDLKKLARHHQYYKV